jgi:SAM-dependent methyltransferase
VRRKRLNPPRVFDQKHYESLNTSRAAVVTRLLSELKDKLSLRTAIDVGCGFGYFSGLLDSLGLEVTAVDGREENVEECRRRFPKIPFHWCNVEDPAILRLGKFDLVLCFGLLYHLENPFLAIRHLRALATKLLLAESVIFPGSEPVMGLVEEGHLEDQSLNYAAFYPTEACLTKTMYKAGFGSVYRVRKMPDHPDFSPPKNLRRVRTMLVASLEPLGSWEVAAVAEPSASLRPWDARSGTIRMKLAKTCRTALSFFSKQGFLNQTFRLRRRLGLRRDTVQRMRLRVTAWLQRKA